MGNVQEANSSTEAGWRTVAFALGNRWVVLASAALVATLLIGAQLIRSRSYTVRTSFSLAGPDAGLSAYAGVAAQLGFQLPTSGGKQPPDFYVYIMRSDAMLRGLAWQRFASPADADSVQFADLLRVPDADSALKELKVIAEIRRLLNVRYDPRSQLVQMEVKTRWPWLSYQLSAALLEKVDRFDRDVLRTQAGEERRFSESRVAEIAAELKAAEDALTAFLARNREFQTSPVLRVQEARLEREVQTRQSLYLTLRQAYEQARLQEIRNTPVISIIEGPVFPGAPDRRHLIRRGLLGLLLGTVLGFVIGLIQNALGRAAGEQQILAETVAVQVAAFGRELSSPRRMWRELLRELRGGPRQTD